MLMEISNPSNISTTNWNVKEKSWVPFSLFSERFFDDKICIPFEKIYTKNDSFVSDFAQFFINRSKHII